MVAVEQQGKMDQALEWATVLDLVPVDKVTKTDQELEWVETQELMVME